MIAITGVSDAEWRALCDHHEVTLTPAVLGVQVHDRMLVLPRHEEAVMLVEIVAITPTSTVIQSRGPAQSWGEATW
ncbi:hypothetical protein [Sulfobacillus thermosulfidooxidans]|uniref:hypothetical protein n=1 Tax=Sulfobacillus thermosulfidooxidans TaxID=28034 RepID=UPI0006B42AB4|nr:hypothetical protein [Sulfobacillus thermosulfidooxidans]